MQRVDGLVLKTVDWKVHLMVDKLASKMDMMMADNSVDERE